MGDSAVSASLCWKTTRGEGFTCCEFGLVAPGGLLEAANLAAIVLPDGLDYRQGLIFSGRGPVWLYAYLTHLAHPFAWVAIHDPRLGGAVVVQRHVPGAPPLGAIVPLPVSKESKDA